MRLLAAVCLAALVVADDQDYGSDQEYGSGSGQEEDSESACEKIVRETIKEEVCIYSEAQRAGYENFVAYMMQECESFWDSQSQEKFLAEFQELSWHKRNFHAGMCVDEGCYRDGLSVHTCSDKCQPLALGTVSSSLECQQACQANKSCAYFNWNQNVQSWDNCIGVCKSFATECHTEVASGFVLGNKYCMTKAQCSSPGAMYGSGATADEPLETLHYAEGGWMDAQDYATLDSGATGEETWSDDCRSIVETAIVAVTCLETDEAEKVEGYFDALQTGMKYCGVRIQDDGSRDMYVRNTMSMLQAYWEDLDVATKGCNMANTNDFDIGWLISAPGSYIPPSPTEMPTFEAEEDDERRRLSMTHPNAVQDSANSKTDAYIANSKSGLVSAHHEAQGHCMPRVCGSKQSRDGYCKMCTFEETEAGECYEDEWQVPYDTSWGNSCECYGEQSLELIWEGNGLGCDEDILEAIAAAIDNVLKLKVTQDWDCDLQDNAGGRRLKKTDSEMDFSGIISELTEEQVLYLETMDEEALRSEVCGTLEAKGVESSCDNLQVNYKDTQRDNSWLIVLLAVGGSALFLAAAVSACCWLKRNQGDKSYEEIKKECEEVSIPERTLSKPSLSIEAHRSPLTSCNELHSDFGIMSGPVEANEL